MKGLNDPKKVEAMRRRRANKTDIQETFEKVRKERLAEEMELKHPAKPPVMLLINDGN